MSNQPKWKYVANLGDRSPLDYGGYFVYVDETGVYAPEAEYLVVDNEHETDDEKLTYTAYRFTLEPCTYANGILSDNPYHPGHAAWFANPDRKGEKYRFCEDLAGFSGQTAEELIGLFLSEDPCKRAHAWRCVGDYHGYENLDSDPLHFGRDEAEKRYAEELKMT